MIRGVGHKIPSNIKQCQVLENSFLKFRLRNVISVNFESRRKIRKPTRSLEGFVSSKRMINRPLYIFEKYWLSMAALACPICK